MLSFKITETYTIKVALPKRKVILFNPTLKGTFNMIKLFIFAFFIWCVFTRFKLVLNFFYLIIGMVVITFNKIFGGQTVFYHGYKEPRKMKNFQKTYKADTSSVIDNEEVKYRNGKYTM